MVVMAVEVGMVMMIGVGGIDGKGSGDGERRQWRW